MVVEEGKWRTECEAIEPRLTFASSTPWVEVDTVDAAFQHVPFEQVQVSEFAHVYGTPWRSISS